MQKASNDEQLLLIHDTEKILGHHDRYFPGGKPLEFTPSVMLPQLESDEIVLHNIVKSRNMDDLISFLEARKLFSVAEILVHCKDVKRLRYRYTDGRNEQLSRKSRKFCLSSFAFVSLQNSPRLDINCEDYDGNTALVLAVKNGDEDMVDLLLEFEDIVVDEALLHAVQLGHYNIVEMLIGKQRWFGLFRLQIRVRAVPRCRSN